MRYNQGMQDGAPDNTVVLAVSGGVDSMVLLDALVHGWLGEVVDGYTEELAECTLVIAHFNHGIREDAHEDEAFVRVMAEHYGLRYESGMGHLGKDVSEDQARKARYKFLRQCCKKYNAPLMTAHHQGDVVETMIINLIRGTGWRGLTPMNGSSSKFEVLNSKQISNSNDQKLKHEVVISVDTGTQSANLANQDHAELRILRPLLDTPKSTLLEYAKRRELKWREDSTNQDQTYLRNYVRHTIIPNMLRSDPTATRRLLMINQSVQVLHKEIATILQKILRSNAQVPDSYVMLRYDLIMLPFSAAKEIIYATLTQLDPDWHPSEKQVERCLHFVKTGFPLKTLQVSAGLELVLSRRHVQFKKV